MNGSREPDQSIERLLRQSFKTSQAGVTAACLDAETIAAWVDGGLSGAALEIAQSHVADCARCQSIVGTLVRTTAVAPQPERAPRQWLGWLVPLTVAATAFALWVAIPQVLNAPSPQATDARKPAFEAKAPEATLESQIQAPATASAPAVSQARAGEEQRQAKSDLARSDEPNAAADLSKDKAGLETDRLRQESQAIGGVASSAPADQAAGAAAAVAPPAAPAAREAFGARSANAVAERAASDIVSPDPLVRWRLVGSVVEHSTNSGSNWDAVFNGGASVLTAGAAPSTSVCWVVGRAGIVLRSTDGRNFSRAAFPETTDLAEIRAVDAETASVTTTDGRTFSTTDGGRRWSLVAGR